MQAVLENLMKKEGNFPPNLQIIPPPNLPHFMGEELVFSPRIGRFWGRLRGEY